MMPLIELRRYRTADHRVPYSDWLRRLDFKTAGRVEAYVDRMKMGNLGYSRSVGQGVIELKINFGPGFRVYYLRDGNSFVVLLCGGDKSSQQTDVRKAQIYALDYWRRR